MSAPGNQPGQGSDNPVRGETAQESPAFLAARARFEIHREAFAKNRPLQELYGRWYRRVAAALPPRDLGPRVELGAGPGLSIGFLDDVERTDVVAAPSVDRVVDAQQLPYPDGSLGALVLVDVLHHLPSPQLFFSEAARVLPRGGRIVLCEPFVSPVSWPVYRFFHEEELDADADPWGMATTPPGDPFAGNQAIPTRLFVTERQAFEGRAPGLVLREVSFFAGPGYPATGGFGRRGLPWRLWRVLQAIEDALPVAAFRWIGFRMFVVIERT